MNTWARITVAALASVVLLAAGGCATTRMIDSDVQSFTAATPAVTPALYRFERLPSQSQNDAMQDQVEALAAQALAKIGLTPAPLVSGAISGTAAAAPTARYAVQVSVQVSAILSPYNSLAYGGYPYIGQPYFGGVMVHRGWGTGFGINIEPSWFRHAVRIVLRDSATGQTAYETTASFDGPWNDSARLLPVVFDAALQGYPNPPQGVRKVTTELPPQPKSTDTP